MLENLFMDRTRDNEEIPKRVVNDQEFRKVAAAYLLRERKKTAHILPTDHLTW
jgi:hypothetical protein